MKRAIETPYKDLNGEIIKVGDVIIFGMLGQHWKVKQKKGKFTIQVISNDSGKGYSEDMENCSLDIEENNTYICKEGCYTA